MESSSPASVHDGSPGRIAGRARTLLFTPGDRPERFQRAAGSGAGLVVLDLEDAVAEDRKAIARDAVGAWARPGPVAVRINPASSKHHLDDVRMVAGLGVAVMLPKVESAHDVESLAGRLTVGQPVIALIESAGGVLSAAEICRCPRVVRVALGHFDLAVDLEVDPEDREALLSVRCQLVLAARAAGLPGPVDGVSADLHDEERLIDDARYAVRLGMTGKLCVHPRQIGPVTEAFAPDPDEVARARLVVESVESGVGVVDGRMVDAPVLTRARQLLDRAGEGWL